jgi:ABC-type phosphate transport system substrate-binding protein
MSPYEQDANYQLAIAVLDSRLESPATEGHDGFPAHSGLSPWGVRVAGAGSTWAQNAINTWVSDVAQDGLQVNYSGVGSTSGRTDFRNGIVNFAASEIPYGLQDGNNFDPSPTRGYAYVPDVAGGLAFMYNLVIGGQRVTNLRLSGAVIAAILTNQITMWVATQSSSWTTYCDVHDGGDAASAGGVHAD